MLRKIMIALTVLVAVGALSDNANARWAGGGRFHGGGAHWRGGGGHWHGHGGHWHGHRGHWHGGWGWPAAAVGFGLGYGAAYYGAGYYGYGYPYYGSGCYRTVRVARPNGWRWRRVWVCG